MAADREDTRRDASPEALAYTRGLHPLDAAAFLSRHFKPAELVLGCGATIKVRGQRQSG